MGLFDGKPLTEDEVPAVEPPKTPTLQAKLFAAREDAAHYKALFETAKKMLSKEQQMQLERIERGDLCRQSI